MAKSASRKGVQVTRIAMCQLLAELQLQEGTEITMKDNRKQVLVDLIKTTVLTFISVYVGIF